jgi:hypothetical protein
MASAEPALRPLATPGAEARLQRTIYHVRYIDKPLTFVTTVYNLAEGQLARVVRRSGKSRRRAFTPQKLGVMQAVQLSARSDTFQFTRDSLQLSTLPRWRAPVSPERAILAEWPRLF